MTQIELFAGIGGFGLAGHWAGIETVCQVEIDPWCLKRLAKNFPHAHRHADIKTFDGTPWRGVDIVSGGFPCQPYSHAGKRKGNDDDRALWPEMLRVIREVQPLWIVGENVAGLISMDGGRVFDGIISDLENAGYTTETFIIPAISVGAPHKRDRLWIVAHAGSQHGALPVQQWRQDAACDANACGENRFTADANGFGKREPLNGPVALSPQRDAWQEFGGGNWTPEFAANPISQPARMERPDSGGQGREPSVYPQRKMVRCGEWPVNAKGVGASFVFASDTHIRVNGQRQFHKRIHEPLEKFMHGEAHGAGDGSHWREHWLQVATRICRVDDGLPRRVDRGKRLKALGNAIVPQIAYQIFKSITQYQNHNT